MSTIKVIRKGSGRRKVGETTTKQIIAGIVADNQAASNRDVIALAVAQGVKLASAQVYVYQLRKELKSGVNLNTLID